MKARIVDTMIVGGGIAGLYTAWRLQSSGINVMVCEATERVGGRIATVPMPGTNLLAELGAMRYHASHVLLVGLVRELRLKTIAFPFATTNHYFLRGEALRAGDESSASFPYKVEDTTLRGVQAFLDRFVESVAQHIKVEGVLLSDSAQEELSALRHDPSRIANLGLESRRAIRRHGRIFGQLLHQVGLWNLLYKILGNEGFSYLHDALGYESIVANWNAADAIDWMLRDFPSAGQDDLADIPVTLKRGMEGVIVGLLERLTKGGSIVETRRELVSISGDEFSQNLTLTFRHENSFEDIGAKRVILAIPQKSLREVKIYGKFKNRELTIDNLGQFEEAIGSVTAHPLFKLLLAYPRAWWKHGMKLITDLPVRQVYCWPPDENGAGYIMASYSDEHYVDFWRSLHRQPDDEPYMEGSARRSRGDSQEVIKTWGASGRMVQKAHQQVAHAFHHCGILNVTNPSAGLEKEWAEGWHTWNSHAQSWKVMKLMAEPFPGWPIHVCGEAFSCDQGWIEGALKSSELLLYTLGVPSPNWMDVQSFLDGGAASYEDYVCGLL